MEILKKAPPLACLALALAALAAPAAQAERYWFYEGQKVGGINEPVTVTSHGTLSLKVKGSAFVSGPCKVSSHGYLWNSAMMGEGIAEKFQIDIPCETNLTKSLDCTIVQATVEELPWHRTVTGPEAEEVKNIKVTFEYNQACQNVGVPAEMTVVGVATGNYNSFSHELEFKDAGDLTVTGTAVQVLLNGSLRTTAPKQGGEEGEEGEITIE